MTTDDLKSTRLGIQNSDLDYSAVLRPSVNVTYRDYVMHSCPAPSSGTSTYTFQLT